MDRYVSPHDATDRRLHIAGDKTHVNNDRLQSLYRADDEKGYAKLMRSLFKQVDNIVVTLDGDRPVVDVEWPEYYFKELREACDSKPVTAKSQAQQQSVDDLLGSTGYAKADKQDELDELLNSTGYSRQETSERNIEKADAAYNRIKDYKDKAALTEARCLYGQETGNSADAEHARNQIARIDRVLNYKPPKGGYLEIYRDDKSRKYGLKIKGGESITEPKYYGFTVNRDSTLFGSGFHDDVKGEYVSEIFNCMGEKIYTKNSSVYVATFTICGKYLITTEFIKSIGSKDPPPPRQTNFGGYELYIASSSGVSLCEETVFDEQGVSVKTHKTVTSYGTKRNSERASDETVDYWLSRGYEKIDVCKSLNQ